MSLRASSFLSGIALALALQPTLTLREPVHHLGVLAREPMVVEHPSGTLFLSGYGAGGPTGTIKDVPALWKSTNQGATWSRVDIGRAEDGAVGNSDVDLAVAPDGTLYFANMVYDRTVPAGLSIHIAVSRDAGVTWKWTELSNTRYDDRPWVKVAPDGTAHAIWNDGEGVNHAVSSDRGATWTERPKIHPEGGSSHLAIGPKGEIAVRITPLSASGFKHHPEADFVAVSTDRGKTWQKHKAPGTRTWTFPMNMRNDPSPRWVEPLAWDAAGSLFYLWTEPGSVKLARSRDQGKTWQTWIVADAKDATAFFPYLVARGRGELAATWFSAKLPDYATLRTHVAKITAGDQNAAPRVAAATPFQFEAMTASGARQAGGEYVPVIFLRNGKLGIATPIQNGAAKRFGFSWWIAE